jgi:hypothetical protein
LTPPSFKSKVGVYMSFKLWSQTNKEVLKDLRPDFGFRSWDVLSSQDKYKIWKYLEEHFFNKDIKQDYNHPDKDASGYYYEFQGEYREREVKRKRIGQSIVALNHYYKAKTFAEKFLEHPSWNNACSDFYSIFTKQPGNVVLELLSLYCRVAIVERDDEYFSKGQVESDEDYEKRKEKWKWVPFEEFAKDLNEVFAHFGLNIYLTRLGFIPRQEQKILEEVFEPVIISLAHSQWKDVNQLLSDAFKEYRQNTPTGFSNCVTNTVSAVQAFLQIIVNGKIGSGDISKLVPQAQAKGLIPGDPFTESIFKNIESILMRERQETGISHPKKEYANEKNARMVLNLAMVFFQHCTQN